MAFYVCYTVYKNAILPEGIICSSGVYCSPSQRTVLCANKGMVFSPTPLVAQADIAVMRKGGNAIDAAVAAAATLPVIEFSGNGIGGDAFVPV